MTAQTTVLVIGKRYNGGTINMNKTQYMGTKAELDKLCIKKYGVDFSTMWRNMRNQEKATSQTISNYDNVELTQKQFFEVMKNGKN